MIDLSVLGTIQPDGSVLIDNTNIAYREAMSGNYEQIRQTAEQKFQLANWGFTQTNSSFISGVGVFGDDLRIRFHNGSVYAYYGFADYFDNIMKSLSKGQYFNKNIRPTKKYAKIGNLDFTGGNTKIETDNEVFEGLKKQQTAKMLMMLQGAKISTEQVVISGVGYDKIIINNIIYYRPIKS